MAFPPAHTLAEALKAGESLTKKYGTSYYASMLLFPARTRRAVFALYGFARSADEIVDTEGGTPREVESRLETFRAAWHTALREQKSEDPILWGAAWVFNEYQIPQAWGDSFLDAMLSDTRVTRYTTYADLEGYMYGSAAVIGLMLSKIIGVSSEDAYTHAKDLGYAMQLTNFLRDINEDYELRGRIYLPQEDMGRFGVTEEMIASKKVTPEFIALMKYEIAKTRALFASGDAGIQYLQPEGRKAVRLARVLYSKILDRIEDAQYDVFSTRCYTTTFQKVRYAVPVLFTS